MKILVTGGSGFLGGAFIARCADKYDIVAPASGETDLRKIAEVNRLFKEHKFDAVVHLAAVADNQSASLVEADNLIMFKNLQYVSIINGVKKLLIAGDCAEFDRTRAIADIKETAFGESIPTDGYGLGRYLIHLLASKDKISTTLRFFSVYGPGADCGTNPVMAMIARGVTGKKVIELDADKVISALYVDDAVKVIDKFLSSDLPRGDYNVVPDKKTSYAEIARTVRRLAKKDGREVEIRIASDGFFRECSGSNEKLAAAIPSLRFTSLTGGVTKTYEHLKAHKSQARPKKDNA